MAFETVSGINTKLARYDNGEPIEHTQDRCAAKFRALYPRPAWARAVAS